MAIQNSDTYPYDSVTTRDISTTPSDTSESGGGGEDMNLWDLTMEEKYDFVSYNKIDVWSDESSYDVFDESGVLSPSWGKYNSLETHPSSHSSTGTVLNTDGTDLSGYVSLRSPDGETVTSQAVLGSFEVALGPPLGVESGPDLSFDGDYEVAFEPDGDGVPVVKTLTGLTVDMGEVQYGSMIGTVLDSEGEPVGDVEINSGGTKTRTDPNGKYALLAPGGTSIDVSSLGGDYSKTVELVGGEVNRVDWQYAGIYVTLNLPGGISISNAPAHLSITENKIASNKSGVAKFTEVPVESEGTVTLLDEKEIDVTSGAEGFANEYTVELGVGFKGTVTEPDATPIHNLDVMAVGDRAFRVLTGDDGSYTVGSIEDGELSLVIGRNDPRYKTKVIDVEVSDGDLVTENAPLDRNLAQWRS